MSQPVFPNLSKTSYAFDQRAGVMFSTVLDGLLWLSHGVTLRAFASGQTDTFDLMAEVRRRLVPGGLRIFFCEQVHGSRVEVVESACRYADTDRAVSRGPAVQLQGTDALVVCDPALPIAIRTADCVPVLLVDVRRRRVGLVHAGWRGSLEGIGEKAVAEMARMGSDPPDLIAWMGPAISRDAYEISPELAARFESAFPQYDGILEGNRLDLILLNAFQLRAAGVPPAQVHAANCCTAGSLDRCYSYRAEGERAGRMVTFAMILSCGPIDTVHGQTPTAGED